MCNVISEGLDNFTFGKNLYWDGNGSTTAAMFNDTGKEGEGFATWQAKGKDAGSILADPEFADATKFSLKPTR